VPVGPTTLPPADKEPAPTLKPTAPSREELESAARAEIFALIPAYKDAYVRNLDQKTRMLIRNVEVQLENVRITLAPDLASATISATRVIKYQWVRPGMPPQSPPTSVTFGVVKTSSGWRLQ